MQTLLYQTRAGVYMPMSINDEGFTLQAGASRHAATITSGLTADRRSRAATPCRS